MEHSTRTLTVDKKENLYAVADGVTGMKIIFVNVYFVRGSEGPSGNWVLVDAGLYGSAQRIKKVAEAHFGKDARPSAIILTHGHFDHVGALKELALEWNVPIYANHLEIPYLTGLSSYPPPDPSVGGGAMAYMSFMYPKKPINVGGLVQPLPTDGSVPGLPEWRWFHTPGHSPGHVSFFRERDRTLIVGDAVVTRKPESALAVLTDDPEICGPPTYFTPDWAAARQSVEAIAALQPNVIASGHGVPMRGERMRDELEELAKYFDQLAVPTHGRYVNQPAVMNEQGVISVPDAVSTPATKALKIAGLITVAGLAAFAISRRKKNNKANSAESPLDNHPYYGEEMNLSVYGEIPEVEDNELLRRSGPKQHENSAQRYPGNRDFIRPDSPSNEYP
ncbi:MBL fold metallo-hydrolase [Adhaeribacter terreus]|uniref:MBL fold metallo-hydrolase n=1 Tax=Adhaeribacter terreus TaxID=529703 RepID=A0ABW0EDW7_9BACT